MKNNRTIKIKDYFSLHRFFIKDYLVNNCIEESMIIVKGISIAYSLIIALYPIFRRKY